MVSWRSEEHTSELQSLASGCPWRALQRGTTSLCLFTPFALTSLAHTRRKTWDGFSGDEMGRGTAIPIVPASKCESSCLSSAACHSLQLGSVMRFLRVNGGRAFSSSVMWPFTSLRNSDQLQTWVPSSIRSSESGGVAPVEGALESAHKVGRW